MRLSADSIARARERPHPGEQQPELPGMPPPMTLARSRDFGFNLGEAWAQGLAQADAATASERL